MAAGAAAAAAAATFRSLLHTTTTSLPSRLHFKPYTNLSSHLHLHLHLVPPTPRRLLLSFFSAADAYNSDEDKYEEKEEARVEEEEEEFTAELQASQASPARPPPGQEPGRLFVGNLPFSMTSSDLAEAFSEAGTVDNVQVIYDRFTDRSRGFAFVTMATPEEASKAIEMFDGAQLGGRTVKVNLPEVPRGGEREVLPAARARGGERVPFVDSPHQLYAGNLGWGVRAAALREAFTAQPGLLGAKVIFNRDTGRSRGFGFVSFETAEDVQAAIDAMDGVELEGRPLRLSLAVVRPTAGSSPDPETQEQQEGSTSESAEAEMEESNLQAAASY